MACIKEEECCNTGSPVVWLCATSQLDAREGEARRDRVAERPVVPRKLGNARGGKGPWFKINVRSSKGGEIG